MTIKDVKIVHRKIENAVKSVFNKGIWIRLIQLRKESVKSEKFVIKKHARRTTRLRETGRTALPPVPLLYVLYCFGKCFNLSATTHKPMSFSAKVAEGFDFSTLHCFSSGASPDSPGFTRTTA